MTKDERSLALAMGAGALLGGLAVVALGGSRNAYAILGGVWLGGMAPAAYRAFKTDREGRELASAPTPEVFTP